MAATNDPNVTAEILARVNSDLEKFGYITEDTARAMKDAETGVKNFAKKADQAADLTVKAFTAVASTGIEAAMAMHEGAKGNQAFNSSLDKMKEGVEATGALLTALIPGGPLVKAFVAALTLAAGKAIDMQKVYGKMSDDLFKGFQDISKSGAAASDGMTGLQAGMRKLGLGVQDMDSYVKAISASSKDLALFKGSVFEGRKAFENIGQGMQQYNYQLRAAGMNQEDINAGTMGYLKLQTRLGQAQNMTTQQLADGAKKYLIEQDALTKLTGQSRESAEKQAQDALMEEAYLAKIRQLQLQGNTQAVEKMRLLNQAYSEFGGPGMAKAFRASTTGFLTNADALKYNQGSNMELMRTTQAVIANQMDYKDALNITGKAFRRNVDALGTTLGQVEVYGDFMGSLYESNQFALASENNFVKQMDQITEDQKNAGIKGGKAQDDLTDANIRLAKVQQEEMLKLQAITAQGMKGAVDNNIKLATAAGQLAPIYDQLTIAMIKFNAMMGRVVDYILPQFIKGMNFLLDKLGLAMASDLEKQEKGFYGDAGAAGGAAIGMYAPGFWKALAVPLGAGIGKVVGDIYGTVKSGNFLDTEEMMSNAIPGMAVGGPVKANAPYIVGEKGPELFVPKSAGNIVANNDLQQNVSMPNMPDMSAEYKKIEAGILSASKNAQMLADLTPEYKKIDLATKDIVADIQRMAKYDDLRATNTKTFTEKYTDYTKSMSDLLDQDLVNTTRFMEAGGTVSVSGAMSSGGGYGGGQGIKPSGSGAPGLTGGDSLQGLKMKKGDVHAEGAGVHPKLVEMARQVQANMPNFAYFSAFNDQYHQENAPSSFHTKGLAMDFALSKAPTKEEGQAIVKYLQSIGASTAIDEYNNPSSKSTAGHIHAQIPGFADGGIAMEPTIAMVAEKAPEVMMPLTNDGFLGQLNTSINSLLPQQQRMVSLLEDMGRSMQATATASERMAAVASN
jgi:hypothetical protein